MDEEQISLLFETAIAARDYIDEFMREGDGDWKALRDAVEKLRGKVELPPRETDD